MNVDYKAILGIAAVAMTVAAHLPYLRATLRGDTRPHLFTWIIWTLLGFIAFAGQVAGRAGPGCWVTGVTAVICVVITAAAWRQADRHATRGDWVMFLGGLAAIPLWLVTNDPLWSMILVCLIDGSAFVPTMRKAWHRPDQENSFMYGFNLPRHVVALAALRDVTLTTALYPAMLLAMNGATYAMLKLRRVIKDA